MQVTYSHVCVIGGVFAGALSPRTARGAIRDIADVVCQRAELLIQDWEDRHNTQGPVLDEDFLAGMVQQTMFWMFRIFIVNPSHGRVVRGSRGCLWSPSWEEISKDVVLEFVDGMGYISYLLSFNCLQLNLEKVHFPLLAAKKLAHNPNHRFGSDTFSIPHLLVAGSLIKYKILVIKNYCTPQDLDQQTAMYHTPLFADDNLLNFSEM